MLCTISRGEVGDVSSDAIISIRLACWASRQNRSPIIIVGMLELFMQAFC